MKQVNCELFEWQAARSKAPSDMCCESVKWLGSLFMWLVG